MLDHSLESIERHINTHSARSDDDRAAVSVLETFLRSNGRINTSFSTNDKWPNHDGYFEFVPNPDLSRRPMQTFCVQIMTTTSSGGMLWPYKGRILGRLKAVSQAVLLAAA